MRVLEHYLAVVGQFPPWETITCN